MKKIFLLTGILIFSCKNPSTLDSKIQKESPNYTVSCDLVYDYERAKQFTFKYLDAMPEALRLVTAKEEPILEAARKADFNIDKLKKAWAEAQKIQ